MEYILFVILAAGAAWYYAMSRGRLTTRASYYIFCVNSGSSSTKANNEALAIDFNAASKMRWIVERQLAISGGSQLDIISEARLLGFRG